MVPSPSFFNDVGQYFDAACQHTEAAPDILGQIRACNAYTLDGIFP